MTGHSMEVETWKTSQIKMYRGGLSEATGDEGSVTAMQDAPTCGMAAPSCQKRQTGASALCWVFRVDNLGQVDCQLDNTVTSSIQTLGIRQTQHNHISIVRRK